MSTADRSTQPATAALPVPTPSPPPPVPPTDGGGEGPGAAEPSGAETLASFTATAAAAFYLAESGTNPSVRDYWDAYHYVATSLSVGYANIFPCTAAGKVIGAVVMMVGPALSARALEPPAPPSEASAILARLDAILAELRRPR